MNKQKITILSIIGILAIGIISGGVFLNSKSSEQEKVKQEQVSKIETVALYSIKQEIKADTFKIENIKSDSTFEVGDVLAKGEKLTVTVNTDVEDSAEAYKLAISIDMATRDLNKEKIKTDGISNVEVILKGKNKNWMYNGSDSINEIVLN